MRYREAIKRSPRSGGAAQPRRREPRGFTPRGGAHRSIGRVAAERTGA